VVFDSWFNNLIQLTNVNPFGLNKVRKMSWEVSFEAVKKHVAIFPSHRSRQSNAAAKPWVFLVVGEYHLKIRRALGVTTTPSHDAVFVPLQNRRGITSAVEPLLSGALTQLYKLKKPNKNLR